MAAKPAGQAPLLWPQRRAQKRDILHTPCTPTHPSPLFSSSPADYRERVLRHEAAHFLLAYLLGVPVAAYSLSLGTEHTDLAEAKLQQRLIERRLEPREVDVLSLIAMVRAGGRTGSSWLLLAGCSRVAGASRQGGVHGVSHSGLA